ncbi:MAG: ABC transporter ATP-binding protein/permease [Oscillospiraceae bacterium]|nr:ABC transporter ATP-binding protein/permease [Oscillospiraceae bacterium]
MLIMFKKLTDDVKIIKRGFSVIHDTQSGVILLNIICAVFEAVTPFINIYLSAEILNELGSGKDIRRLTILVALTVGLNLLVYLIKQLLYRLINICNSLFENKLTMRMNNKTLSTDYANIENFDTRMKRQRINDLRNVNGRGIWFMIYNMRNIIRSLFVIIFAAVMSYKIFFVSDITGEGTFYNIINSPLVSFIMLALIIINVIFTMYANATSAKKSYVLFDGGVTSANTVAAYIVDYVTGYNAGKDIRLYNQKKMLSGEFSSLIDKLKPNFNQLEKNQKKYGNINSAMAVVISCLVYLFVGFKALAGAFLIGNILKYVGSINEFISGFSGFMNGFTEFRNNNEALRAYFDFMEIPDSLFHGTLTTEKRADNEYEIEFRNVSFKYPGTDTYALKNLNLKFNIGQRMAVVGMNGSGKTTMIKLLCRLYDPTEGEITLNGIDIKKYDYDEYMSIFSVVFQDFKLFSFTLGQNVTTSVDVDGEWAAKCLSMAGLDERLSSMPKGLDTPLYKDFEEDGVEISGGEAQKIALARALYKDAPFIVLDEPTAALDPIAEFEVYSKFNEIVGGKTAIYISHRLSSCRFCDDIAVFHEGELIQRGSHDALIADEGGKYHELWTAQAQYYAENTGNH